MRPRLKKALDLLPSLLSLATGEGISRLCNLLLLIYISHRFGVGVTGAFALAQALSFYLILGIDLGLRHIGARLVASHPDQLHSITEHIQKKRFLMMILAVSGGFLYGLFGPLPHDARQLVSLYSLSMGGYALSLDWVAWGLKQFRWVALWRASISLLTLAISLYCISLWHAKITATALSNGIGYIAAALLLWLVWWKRLASPRASDSRCAPEVQKQMAWRSAIWMGSALFVNQAFNNIDVMMLGAYSNSHEVGLYNAAYRMVLMILAVYYLLTQALFPTLTQYPPNLRNLRPLRGKLILLFLCGTCLSILLHFSGPKLIVSFFGREFSGAIRLLRILVVILPLDFVTSFLCNAMTAWGYAGSILASASMAMLTNVALNFYFLPRLHAVGAAWVTDVSYLVLLLMMTTLLGRKSLSPTGAAQLAEKVAK